MSSFQKNGLASFSGDRVSLNQADADSKPGSVWTPNKLRIKEGFVATFKFTIETARFSFLNVKRQGNANGFAFVIQGKDKYAIGPDNCKVICAGYDGGV